MNSPQCNRRTMIRSLVGGSILLPGILSDLLAADKSSLVRSGDALAPRPPHHEARAKRVIFLYLSGGVSHVDSFDPKPKLWADAGKSLGMDKEGKPTRFLKRPEWAFSANSVCGTEVSDLFPHLRSQMDDICLIRSLKGDHGNHVEATLGIHTGSVTVARPSIGSWVSYGLGSVNRNLPSFVVLAPELPYGGAQVWSADVLPGAHQGTRIVPGAVPIANLEPRLSSEKLQELELGLLETFNRRHLRRNQANPLLAARIKSFETAFGLQREAPEAFDLSHESEATLRLYGLARGDTEGFAWQCLVARRLCERGVRFIEVIDTGSHSNWDSHNDMADHYPLAINVDRPIAALLQDLKSRGLLEDTLVVCTTEFGRTPYVDKAGAKGREHHSQVFWSWLAGAGVKKGMVYGASDDYGMEAAENPVSVHDFHATILHLLGLDHERLTFHSAGQDFRLTDVFGRVINPILT